MPSTHGRGKPDSNEHRFVVDRLIYLGSGGVGDVGEETPGKVSTTSALLKRFLAVVPDIEVELQLVVWVSF